MKEILSILAAAILPLAIGCSRSPRLAEGPIDVTELPAVVRFDRPVHATGPMWEMCFEFDRSADSRDAGRIHLVLLSTSGRRYTLSDVTLDRQGESVVCHVGRVTEMEPEAERSAPGDSVVFEAVELSAEVPVRLRALRGGSRS